MSIARLSLIAVVLLPTCAAATVQAPARHPGARVVRAAFEPARRCHAGAAPDFDGDGVRDLAVGAPYATSEGRRRAGAVAVRYGGRPAWLRPSPAQAGAGFGGTIAVGDFDGDHCDDLAVAASDQGRARPGADGTGVVAVYFGSPGGLRPRMTLSVRSLGRTPAGDRFGAALAAADLDHDGQDDLVVGVPGLAGGGGVGLFSRGLRTARLITQHTSWVRQPSGPTDGFGTALAVGAFGAFGRDRRTQIAVGAPGDGIEASGAVTVIDPAAHRSRLITEDSPGVRGVPERYDEFGAALAAGDFDHDGTDDLAIGVPGEDDTAMPDNIAQGAVYVLYGSGGEDVWALRRPGPEDRLGSALAAGDLTGDGTADLAAGAPGGGVVQILDGRRRRGLGRGAIVTSPAGGTAQFGWSLAVRGRDLLIGAPGAGGFGGAAFLTRGSRTTAVQAGTAGELLGYAVS
ncbi:FG-GAP repeat protein [Actinoallomurus rhizosphaericola]|uniref:FG-GAP repeat protein n=1 Tax=Actinoallomurus rhizosphaericola TaxID=2952536 RepID=UPI002091B1E1|nr:FG-GAP and VCBS repeat-containing protein [Actinoallomurus rhizosphaericola]MCO5993603.1 VCBS repeat-containing protein [Actinoallomurus rhizosphaericola]